MSQACAVSGVRLGFVIEILPQSVIVELSATTMRIGEQIMPEEIAVLERRCMNLSTKNSPRQMATDLRV